MFVDESLVFLMCFSCNGGGSFPLIHLLFERRDEIVDNVYDVTETGGVAETEVGNCVEKFLDFKETLLIGLLFGDNLLSKGDVECEFAFEQSKE